MSQAQPRVREFRFLSVPLIVSRVPGNLPQQAHSRGNANCLPETSTLILRPCGKHNRCQLSMHKPNKSRTIAVDSHACFATVGLWTRSNTSANGIGIWSKWESIPRRPISGRQLSSTPVTRWILINLKKPLLARGWVRTPDCRRGSHTRRHRRFDRLVDPRSGYAART